MSINPKDLIDLSNHMDSNCIAFAFVICTNHEVNDYEPPNCPWGVDGDYRAEYNDLFLHELSEELDALLFFDLDDDREYGHIDWTCDNNFHKWSGQKYDKIHGINVKIMIREKKYFDLLSNAIETAVKNVESNTDFYQHLIKDYNQFN